MELAAEAAPLVVLGSRSGRVDLAYSAAKSARPPVRRAAGRAALGWLRLLAQGAEVAMDLLWLDHERDEPEATVATRAAQNVHGERPHHELCPRPIATGGPSRLRRFTFLRGGEHLWRFGHDARTELAR
jgi:hypothetical protein